MDQVRRRGMVSAQITVLRSAWQCATGVISVTPRHGGQAPALHRHQLTWRLRRAAPRPPQGAPSGRTRGLARIQPV